MADANLEVNIEDLHAVILSRIQAAFPSFNTVEFYRDDENQLFPTPACLLAMTECEPQPDMDAGAEQLPVLIRFEAHIVMPHRQAVTPMEVRKAATALASWLYKQRFPPCDETRVIAIEPDEFAPNADKFKVWRVEFVMLGFLGATVWTNEGVIPTEVLYSWSPDIGFGNEDKYTELGLPTQP